MDGAFEYVFPAIRGVQAGHEHFVSMCPMRLIPKMFLFDEEELRPELRAQRSLNKGRIPEMARYILDNPQSYCFSAITASIDAEVKFESLGEDDDRKRVGLLRIPMDARFIINDGQHRRAAIETALRENPDLGDESVAVVFFLDLGLDRCQQMFSDLNRHAIRASKSLGLLYDHRDEGAQVAKLVAFRSQAFNKVVEMERSTLGARSRKLFTLSAIHTATNAFLQGQELPTSDARAGAAIAWWDAVAAQFPEWAAVRERQLSGGDVRRDFIHSHGVVLHALGRVGNAMTTHGNGWKGKLKRLKTIDWSRSNGELWEGRATVGGRVMKNSQNVVLTTNVIKQHLDVPLTPDEVRVEDAFKRGTNG